MTKIAIIGTAGRDKTKPMTAELYVWMLRDAIQRIPKGAHLVSGGAAWADHLAVTLFLDGYASELTLHLPSAFQGSPAEFVGPRNSSASAANWYHHLFSQVIDQDTREQILRCIESPNCITTYEPTAAGYSGMFNRNRRVALGSDQMLAYTFGEGDVPADGGTRDTWDKFVARRAGKATHISLPWPR